MDHTQKKSAKNHALEVSEESDGSEHGKDDVVERDLSEMVSFRQENIVQSRLTKENYYDTIIWWVFTRSFISSIKYK